MYACLSSVMSFIEDWLIIIDRVDKQSKFQIYLSIISPKFSEISFGSWFFPRWIFVATKFGPLNFFQIGQTK